MTAQPHGLHRTPAEIRAVLKADRSPKNIRAMLPEEDRALFDQQYWHAMDKARLSYDLTPVFEFQKSWWWTAYLKADPVEYQETIEAAERAMEFYERNETPQGAVWDDEYDARLRKRIEQGR